MHRLQVVSALAFADSGGGDVPTCVHSHIVYLLTVLYSGLSLQLTLHTKMKADAHATWRSPTHSGPGAEDPALE